jgi:type I restriction enzyme M protein
LRRHHLDEFVELYNSEDLHERQPTYSEENPEGRWRRYSYEESMRREGTSLDLSWIRDKSLEDSADLEDPDVFAEDIAGELEAALEQFAAIAVDLRTEGTK